MKRKLKRIMMGIANDYKALRVTFTLRTGILQSYT